MKLIFILILASLLQVSASSSAQQITIRKGASLERFFREIHRQCGYDVLGNSEILISAKPIETDFINAPLVRVLDATIEKQSLSYIIDGKNIIIRRKQANRSPLTNIGLKITGRVTGENGKPLSGVTVKLKGAQVASSTGIDGVYTIEVPGETGILQFSYIGYESVEVAVDARDRIDVQLKVSTSDLDQIVVVGYGTQKKSDVNAAIVTVKPERIDKSAGPSVDQMLQGQAGGLTVVNSASPGGGVNVYIRGQTSTGAGNGPLVVIDGFPVIYSAVEPGSGNKYQNGGRGALNDINPNDIASIEVLKDASATSIYGARGSNGVILITTKRAKNGTNIEYSFNTSLQKIAKRPELLNATEFMREQNDYLYELYLIQNKLVPYGSANPAGIPAFVPRNSSAAIQSAGVGTDWYDLITQNGRINQHNLQISQGNERTKALFSFNYFGQDGVIRKSGLDRYTLRLNLDQKVTDWWDFGTSISASLIKSQNSQLGGGRDADAGIIESALNYSPVIIPQRDPFTGKWIEDPNQPLLGHPLSYLDITDNTNSKRFLGNIFTNVYLSKAREIWFRINAGADIRSGLRQSYYPKTSRYGSQVNGEAGINRAERDDYVTDFTLNLNKTLGSDHNIQGVLGYSYQIYHGNGSGARAQNFSSDALMYDRMEAGTQRPFVSSYRDRHILASYFTRAQYSFKSRYIFTFSGRVDGSDRFGANNRYAFFPSGAFAWRAIEEDFLKTSTTLSDLKLRLSVGKTGNENIPNDAASEYYGFNGLNYYFNGNLSNGVSLSKIGNPNLKWESTTAYNLGLDIGLFKNRVSASVDVYLKKVSDLLSYRALPQSSIVGSIPWNVGNTTGRGIDITINTVNIQAPFRWTSLLTYTAYADRWQSRDPKVMLQPYQSERDPLTAVFALQPAGIMQPGETVPSMPGLLPGQQKYLDVNGLDGNGKLSGTPDGKINQADVVYIGNLAPKFSMGLNNFFEYKGFDVNFFLYASVGGLKWAGTRIEHSVFGSYGVQLFRSNYNFLKEVQNRWKSTNPTATMPSGEVNSYDSFGFPYFQKASYLRLKTLTIGYNLSESLLKTKWIKGARVYAGGQNLFTITGYEGLDPESEFDRAAYPQQRTFSLGVDLKF